MNDITPTPSGLLTAEWDSRMGATLIAWPHADTDWVDMLDDIDRCYIDLTTALLKAGQKILIVTPEPERVNNLLSEKIASGRIMVVKCRTNDTWTRDYGPLTVENDKGELAPLCYKFDGWGLKFPADKDNRVSLTLMSPAVLNQEQLLRKHYTLEGGSIETDGHGTILTTSQCLLSLNRNGLITKNEVENELATGLQAKHILWLDHGALQGDDTDSHIDTLARLVSDNTIVYVKSYDPADPHTPELDRMEQQLRGFLTPDGKPYKLVGLPLPSPIYDEEGERLPATYANFLITPKAVLMPTYNQPLNDESATRALAVLFSDKEIITVDCRPLIRQHGSLHCATMQLPDTWLPI